DRGKLVEQKSIEVGNIFKLRTRFSEAFKFNYQDKDGKNNLVEMGCYGMGPSRVMGTLVEIFHDEKGIIWPTAVAPFDVHLISLGKENDEVTAAAEKLYSTLKEQEIDVLFDDRGNSSAGEKLNDADLIGIPVRILLSKKTLAQNGAEFKRRNEKSSKIIALGEVVQNIRG
ncbi:MAG: His/Gly/Thr/Pro-type tRNA ligase C-terminal domain-containing protein, partial [Patescibacteria group bacterium]